MFYLRIREVFRAIPITIEKLVNEIIVEWARIDFKEGWNPATTLKTISAFANDIDNWGGGYIVIGLKKKMVKLNDQLKVLSQAQSIRFKKIY